MFRNSNSGFDDLKKITTRFTCKLKSMETQAPPCSLPTNTGQTAAKDMLVTLGDIKCNIVQSSSSPV